MSDDDPTPLAGTEACSVCGLEAMAAIAITSAPLAVIGGYAACPLHVDTVVARVQDNLHEVMAEREGALTDWWEALHPPPEPITVVDDEGTS